MHKKTLKQSRRSLFATESATKQNHRDGCFCTLISPSARHISKLYTAAALAPVANKLFNLSGTKSFPWAVKSSLVVPVHKFTDHISPSITTDQNTLQYRERYMHGIPK